MTTLSSTVTVLFILLALLVAALIVYFVLFKVSRNKIQEHLKKASTQFRQFGSETRSIKSSIQGYSSKDPPPFGPLINQLSLHLDNVDLSGQVWLKRYSEIQQGVLEDERSRRKAFFTFPYRWYKYQGKLHQLEEIQKQMKANIQKSESIIKEINNQGAVLSRHAHTFQQKLSQAEKIITDLRQKNIQGDSLLATYQVISHLQESLNAIQLPALPMDGKQNNSLENKASIINTFRYLNENQPTLEHIDSRTKEWNEQYLAYDSALHQINKVQQEMHQIIEEMPSNLDLTVEKELYQQIDQSIEQIHRQSIEKRLDELTSHTAAIEVILKEAKAFYEKLNNAKWHASEFLQTLTNLRPVYDQLVVDMLKLSSHPTYPVIWNKSQVQLNDFVQRLEKLEPAFKIRSIEQLDTELAGVKVLKERIVQLQDQVKAFSDLYARLTPDLERLGNSDVFDQYTNYQQLIKQVLQYHPDNWDHRDNVNDFEADISSFFENIHNSFPEKNTDPIKETALANLTEEIQKFLAQMEQINQRRSRIQNQLEQIKQAEVSATGKLIESKTFLNQVVALAKTNPKLQKLIIDEAEHLLSALDQTKAELDNHATGLVLKKVQKSNDLFNRIDQANKAWLAEFVKEVQQDQDLLADRVNSLTGIANLDEPNLLNAKDYLQSIKAQLNRKENEGDKPVEDLSQVIFELKKANEDHLQYSAYLNSIEDIDKSIHDAYDKVEKHRQNARNLLIQSAKWFSEAHEWPAISIDLSSEHFEFEQIERSRKATLTEKSRAIWLVNNLGDVSARYQQLAGKIQEAQKHAEDDINKISKIEHDIDESIQLWQYQKNTYSNNTLVTVRINQLIEEITKALEMIKKQSHQSVKSYSDIEQALLALSKKSFNSLIPFKDDQRIDINGEIHIGRS